MIAIIIILIMLYSSADAQTFDDFVRSGYTAYSIGQLEEAKEIFEVLQTEYPDSHLGQILQILVEIREGDNKEAKRLLAEFDNSCNMNSSSCDSPSIHIIAKNIQGKMFGSEPTLRMADEMIGELSDDLYKDCFEAQIDVYLNNENPQEACNSCDKYRRISEGFLIPEIALKCFIAYYSSYRNEDAKEVWRLLGAEEKNEIKKQFIRVEF
ncbi:MAG: hypothetical protein H8D23_12385 [Candidatus Brocadiales bacterium]|nr:hypothetical protein [Candidatus Brocadiales bacterium]